MCLHSLKYHKELNVICSRYVLDGTTIDIDGAMTGGVSNQVVEGIRDHDQIQNTLLSLCNRIANFKHA
jgi:hypothetical protein